MRQDKKSASIKFKHDIQKKITHLKTNPYIYCKSHRKDDTQQKKRTDEEGRGWSEPRP